jgi:hypothetical protein
MNKKHMKFLIDPMDGGIRVAQLLYQLGYGLDDQEIQVRFLIGASIYFFFHLVYRAAQGPT